MDILNTNLTPRDWADTIGVKKYPYLASLRYSYPDRFNQIIDHMTEHDIFADVIPKKTIGGRRIRKRLSKKVYNCSKQTSKKYTTRKSPPYSADSCRNKKMKGNDGKMYISLSGHNSGIYKWYPYSSKLVKTNKIKKEMVLSQRKIRMRNLNKLKSTRKYKRKI